MPERIVWVSKFSIQLPSNIVSKACQMKEDLTVPLLLSSGEKQKWERERELRAGHYCAIPKIISLRSRAGFLITLQIMQSLSEGLLKKRAATSAWSLAQHGVMLSCFAVCSPARLQRITTVKYLFAVHLCLCKRQWDRGVCQLEQNTNDYTEEVEHRCRDWAWAREVCVTDNGVVRSP